jgi:hypothetical protein
MFSKSFEERLTVSVSARTATMLRSLAEAEEEPVAALIRRAIRRLLAEAHPNDQPS